MSSDLYRHKKRLRLWADDGDDDLAKIGRHLLAMHSADSVNIYMLSAECQCSRLMKMGFIHELLQGENCWDGIRFNYDVNYKGLFILRILFHHLSFNMTVTVIVSSDLFFRSKLQSKKWASSDAGWSSLAHSRYLSLSANTKEISGHIIYSFCVFLVIKLIS